MNSLPRSTTAHLLPTYDEYFSGYKDRSAIITREDANQLAGMGGYTFVVNGRVTGVWKRRFEHGAVVIKTQNLRPLSKTEDRAIRTACRAYADFLGMTLRFE
jgi:hypothetical protein